jgi:hypothetical protein
MYEYFFTFRSITLAQRAVRVLDKAGLFGTLLRTPKQIQQQGCGYSVRVRSGIFPETRAELRREAVPFSRIYVRRGGGKWEEVE